MQKQAESPYVAHVFVCTNNRNGARKSCADGGSEELKAALKEALHAKGWQGKVRVSSAGCLGVCDKGPNVMIYPQKLWFSEVCLSDVAELVALLDEYV